MKGAEERRSPIAPRSAIGITSLGHRHPPAVETLTGQGLGSGAAPTVLIVETVAVSFERFGPLCASAETLATGTASARATGHLLRGAHVLAGFQESTVPGSQNGSSSGGDGDGWISVADAREGEALQVTPPTEWCLTGCRGVGGTVLRR